MTRDRYKIVSLGSSGGKYGAGERGVGGRRAGAGEGDPSTVKSRAPITVCDYIIGG